MRQKTQLEQVEPLKAVVEKQNWGVRPGLSCLSATAPAASAPGRDMLEAPETDPSLVVHKSPATVVGVLGKSSNNFTVDGGDYYAPAPLLRPDFVD